MAEIWRYIPALTEFFGARQIGGVPTLAAQRYESGQTSYDPFTDKRLVRLLEAAKCVGRSEWACTKRIVDQLCDAPGGRQHLEVLRLACANPADGWPEVACHTPAAIAHGRKLVVAEDTRRTIEGIYAQAAAEGCSGIATAMRVLDVDRRMQLAGVRVDEWRALEAARSALRHGDLPAAEREATALVDAAAAAYAEASRSLGTEKRQKREREERRRATLRAKLAGKRAAKESERFEARLRRSA